MRDEVASEFPVSRSLDFDRCFDEEADAEVVAAVAAAAAVDEKRPA